ncbi:cytochrome p450 [Lecanosticta acicola]|uniref:Cytochrome p450 n=1 Tax=Lecanosticta acicola TaxID=111012 RepID=A0AAI8YS47_9PEZI|nr:cytochrome p450 [Lecanosticta acicola]
MSKFDISRDIATFLGAGGEPIGATLVCLIYSVLQNPELQRKLEAEAAALGEPTIDGAVAEQCPLLDGAIYEALRLFGGGLTIPPRYASTPQVIRGYTIAPGTEVASHNHQLHRNPGVWGNAEKFDPERWLKRSKALTQDAFHPFSSGPRACIAIHLIMTELRLFAAHFFWEFSRIENGSVGHGKEYENTRSISSRSRVEIA